MLDALVALSVVLLSTCGFIGTTKAGCPPASAQISLPSSARAQASIVLTSASQLPIWKTITIGEYKGANATRAAIDGEPCRITVGDWADEIIGRPAFPYSRTKTELDLVVVRVADLGFGDGASLRDIHARALALGLEPCPAEAGPILRLNYLDQPLGEWRTN